MLNLLPEIQVAQALVDAKTAVRKNMRNLLAQWMPSRLAEIWLEEAGIDPEKRVADMTDRLLQQLGGSLNAWSLTPDGTEGYRKAEVTSGGVDTRALSQQTMMSRDVPGLYFIGESVDVTGWLGGYNFQWAWSSGFAAGMAIGVD